MSIGDPVTQPIPAVSEAGTGYATKLVNFLTEVKTRLEAKVPLTSLLAGLFDLANNPIGNAQYLGLYEQGDVPSTPVGSFQRYGGEAYYVSPDGAVRITNNGTLDVVAANGIGGDYGSPAEFTYSVADKEYFAFSNTGPTPDEWARVGAQGFDIYGTLNSTTRVRLAWGGGASWTLTLPASAPGATSVVQMSSAGALSASNVLPALTGGLDVTGDVVVTGDLTVTGSVLELGSQRMPLVTSQAVETGTPAHSLSHEVVIFAASTNKVRLPIALPVGAHITGYKLWFKKGTSNASEINFDIVRTTNGGADDYLDFNYSNGDNGVGDLVEEVIAGEDWIEEGYSYFLLIAPSGSVAPAADRFYHAHIIWDKASE